MGRTISARWKKLLPKECCNCGATEGLQYHHIVPRMCGGRDIPSNIAVICSDCHSMIHFGERDVIVHNDMIRDGMKKAKERGVKLGRGDGPDAEFAIRTIAENSTQFNPSSEHTEHEVMAMIGLKPTRYSAYKRMLLEAMEAPVWPYTWRKPVQVRNRPLYEREVRRLRGSV